MATAGTASVRIIPNMAGFGASMKKGLGAGAALAFGAFIKSSISATAQFEKSMNMMQAVANVPAAGMERLNKLAIDLGNSTVFSAKDAADAMLELAKAGIKPAEIEAGALAGTLKLAAAGGVEMATAAEIAANALNTFGLKGKDMGKVANALAGGANASSASVESLGQALSQVGPGAVNAGMSINETVAALSAFHSAGIKGSDAGTSFKTFLTRLVPTTNKAIGAMDSLGLNFVQRNGDFKSLANISQQLQDKLGGLSEAEQTRTLAILFGSDATRAASVLMRQGAEGVRKYTRATEDQQAAQRAANAGMKGLPGAIERVKGSFETLQIQVGTALSPLLARIFNGVANMIGGIGSGVEKVTGWFDRLINGAGKVKKALPDFGALRNDIGGAPVDVGAARNAVGGAVGGAVSKATTGELGKTFDAVKAFGASLLPIVQDIFGKIQAVIVPAFQTISAKINGELLPAFRDALPVIQPVASFIIKIIGGAIVGAIQGAVKVIRGVIDIITGLFKFIKAAVTGDWQGMWDAVKQILGGAFEGIIGAIQVWLNVGILALFRQGFKVLLKVFSGTFAAIKGVFTSATKGLENILAKFLGWLVRNVWPAIRGLFTRVISPTFRAIGRIATWLVTRVILPMFRLWGMYFTRVVFPLIRFLLTSVIRPIFTTIWRIIQFAVTRIIIPTFRLLWAFLTRVIFPVFRFLWNNVVRPLITKVGGFIRDTWQNVIKPAFAGIKDFIRGTLVPAFRTGVDAISRIWDGLKAAATAPIRFIVDTVYNNGLRPAINKILDFFKVDAKLPEVTLSLGGDKTGNTSANPTHHAQGGVLPGYTPGRDVHHFRSRTGGDLYLSGGEAIMRPEWTRAVGGPRAVARMNKAARQGKVDRSFFLGGTMPLPGASVSQHTSGYNSVWAGDLNYPGYADYGKALGAWKSGYIAAMRYIGDTSYGRWVDINHGGGQYSRYAHLSGFGPVNVGQHVNAGQTIGFVGDLGNTGSPPTSHLHFEVNGGQVTPGEGGGGGGGGNVVVNWLAKRLAGAVNRFRGLLDKIPGLDNPFGQLVRGAGNKVFEGITGWLEQFGSPTSSGAGGPVPSSGPIKEAARKASDARWPGQWNALHELVQRESSWNPLAQNPNSTAFGLFQFLDSTWATVGGYKTSNPYKQIDFGLRYIAQRYNDPNGALQWHNEHGWYDSGGYLRPGMSSVVNGTRKPEPVLTANQWRDISTLAARGAGASDRLRRGDKLVLQIGREKFEAVVGDIADDRIDLMRETRNAGGRW